MLACFLMAKNIVLFNFKIVPFASSLAIVNMIMYSLYIEYRFPSENAAQKVWEKGLANNKFPSNPRVNANIYMLQKKRPTFCELTDQ